MASELPVYTSSAPAPDNKMQEIHGVTPPSYDAGAIGKSVSDLAAAGEKLLDAQDVTRAIKARTDVASGMEVLREKYSKDPDFQTAPQRFADEAKTLINSSLENVNNPQHRELARLHMTTQLLTNQRHVMSASTGAERNFNLAANDQNEADSTKAYTEAQSPVERAAILRDRFQFIEQGGAAGWLSPREVVDYKLRFADKVKSAENDTNKANLIDDLSLQQTRTLQATIALDPSSEEAKREVEIGVQASAGLYQRAAQSGAISQTTAASAIQDARNNAWVGLIGAHASRLGSPDEIAAYRQRFDADFAAGKYNGRIDAAGYDKAQNVLARLEKQAMTAATSAGTDLRKSLDDYVTREAHGLTPDPAEWNQMLVAARGIPGGDDMVALANAKRSLASRLSALPVDQADTMMRNMREEQRAGGGVTPMAAGLIAFGDKFVADTKKQLGTDTLGFAQERGLIKQIAPLDFDGILKGDTKAAQDGSLAAQFRERATQAAAVAQTLERAPQYFRPEEKARLKEVVEQGGDPALALASAIVKGGAENAGAMLKQLGDDAPRLAQAGLILNSGGSLAAARDAMEFQRLKATSKADIPNVPQLEQSKADTAVLGGAYSLAPAERIRVAQTAEAIARARMVKQGVDPHADPNTAGQIYTRALQEASGAVFVEGQQYGGATSYSTGWFGQKGSVVAPPGVRADRMRELFGALTDEDLARLPNAPAGQASDLASKIPISVPGGYAFATKSFVAGGDLQIVRGRDGKPWVMPWDAVEPELRRRLPDAFLGSRG